MEPDFEWDDDNVDHVARHGIEPEEIEEALTDPDVMVSPSRRRSRERRWEAVGITQGGRVLFVAFTRREGWVRAITAHEATPTEKSRYRRRLR
jgi:uncharacterized DUF497 family protein